MTSKRFIRLNKTDLFVPDETASDGRSKIEVLNCDGSCASKLARINIDHPAFHADNCRKLRDQIVSETLMFEGWPEEIIQCR